jgi:HEAT repeat protein
MANGEFTQLFQTCVESEDDAYLTARDAILALGETVRVPLASQLNASDWRVQLAAQILAGWLDHRMLFEQVASRVEGLPSDSEQVEPISGTFTPAQRARSLASMGTVIVPRLLEILLKTKEYGDTAELQAILQALNVLRDDRAVLPLADLVGRRAPDPARVFALGVLGAMRDARAFDAVQQAFTRLENSPAVRSAAAVALGVFGDRRVTATMLASLQDPTENTSVRRHVARGLGHLGDPTAGTALAGLLQSERSPEMALTAVQALGKLGGASALAALAEAGSTHADATVRRAAEEAHRSLLA